MTLEALITMEGMLTLNGTGADVDAHAVAKDGIEIFKIFNLLGEVVGMGKIMAKKGGTLKTGEAKRITLCPQLKIGMARAQMHVMT